MLFFLVVIGALALGGCALPPVQSPNVPDDVYNLVLKALIASRGLKFIIGKKLAEMDEDKHKGFFVLRRVLVLGQGSAAPHTALIRRIEEDHDEVESFVTKQFSGPNTLGKAAPDGPSDAAPTAAFSCRPEKHLDLDNVTTYRTPPTDTTRLQQFNNFKKSDFETFQARREAAARAIIWRAAGVHGSDTATSKGVWDESKSFPSRLREHALKEILDRRLRVVERMNFQVNARATKPLSASILPRGPWFDTSRVKIFDYPFFDTRRASDLIAMAPDGTSADPLWTADEVVNLPGGRTTQRITYSNSERDTTVSPPETVRVVPTRIRPEPDDPAVPGDPRSPTLNTTWLRDPVRFYAYPRRFVSEATLPGGGTGPKLSGAIDALMVANRNIWDRAWLYCDHVCLALHIDALRFALLRRVGQPDPAGTLDAIGTTPTTNPEGFVWLGGAMGHAPDNPGKPSTWKAPDNNRLFLDGDNAVWFENQFVQPADLQVGDHVVYYNHIAYNVFLDGAFRLENAIVSQIESDPNPKKHGSIVVAGTRLAGHGLGFMTISEYGKAMAEETQGGIKNERDRLEKQTTPPAAFRNSQGFIFLRWTPYPGLVLENGRQPWFVWLPRTFPDKVDTPDALPYKTRWKTKEDMLASITHAVQEVPTTERGPNYNEYPKTFKFPGDKNPVQLTDGVLFPVYLPRPEDESQPLEWPEYFRRKRETPGLQAKLFRYQLSFTASVVNDVVHLSGDLPGLFVAGSELLPIQVLRPKVRI